MLTPISEHSLSSAGNLRGMGVRQVLQPQGRPARQVQTVAKQPLLIILLPVHKTLPPIQALCSTKLVSFHPFLKVPSGQIRDQPESDTIG